MELYNNGYLIKGLFKNAYSSVIENDRGWQSFVTWPLRFYNDDVSDGLETEAFDKWWCYHGVLDLAPEREFLERYTKHCKSIGIDTIIIQVETPRDNQLAIDQLEIVEILGFDCLTLDNITYLGLMPDDFKELFGDTGLKLNNNYLFNSETDAYAYIAAYNKLLENGKNLEYGEDPLPARLSIVEL